MWGWEYCKDKMGHYRRHPQMGGFSFWRHFAPCQLPAVGMEHLQSFLMIFKPEHAGSLRIKVRSGYWTKKSRSEEFQMLWMCDTPPGSGGGYFRHSTPQEVNRNFLCHFGILNVWRSKSCVCNKCQHNSNARKRRGDGPTRKWGIFILVAYYEIRPSIADFLVPQERKLCQGQGWILSKVSAPSLSHNDIFGQGTICVFLDNNYWS